MADKFKKIIFKNTFYEQLVNNEVIHKSFTKAL